jgi:hypothetical protein
MRRHMREAFDELWIIDLGEDNLGARKTDNVFEIRTPVAIAVGIRAPGSSCEDPAHVHYARLEGDQTQKLAALDTIERFGDVNWTTSSSI